MQITGMLFADVPSALQMWRVVFSYHHDEDGTSPTSVLWFIL